MLFAKSIIKIEEEKSIFVRNNGEFVKSSAC